MTRRLPRLALLSLTAGILVGVALVASQSPPPAAKMADAANQFLATLTPEQKQRAAFPFDDPHRTSWFFTPRQDKQKNPTRKGVRLEELDDAQKRAALNLLRTGLSTQGFDQATTIMSLESILAELEKKGTNVRNPGWYFVSVFGEPSNTGSWSWRVEGHHLSVNVTLEKGEVVSATPMMFGANPARVKDGARKGLRTLPQVEDLAKELIASLTAEQQKAARQPKQLPEIRENKPDAGVGAPLGIAAGRLTDAQQATLKKLVEAYANRLPSEVAAVEMKKVQAAGWDRVHFAYCIEDAKPGKPYTYRVQGPSFVVEFLNVQSDSARNPANHIHSAWRRLPADFGLKGN